MRHPLRRRRRSASAARSRRWRGRNSALDNFCPLPMLALHAFRTRPSQEPPVFSRTRFALAVAIIALSAPARAAEGFAFQDTPGDHLDVLLDGKIVARYMYAYDKSTKEKLDLT